MRARRDAVFADSRAASESRSRRWDRQAAEKLRDSREFGLQFGQADFAVRAALGAQHGADGLGRPPHGGVAGRAGVVLGQRAIRRPKPKREGERLAIFTDLRAGEDVEQLDVLE